MARERKLIVVAPEASTAVRAAEDRFGLTHTDVFIVTKLEHIQGLQHKLMIYAGDASGMDDFTAIFDYMVSHDIVCLKTNSGHDFVAPEPVHG